MDGFDNTFDGLIFDNEEAEEPFDYETNLQTRTESIRKQNKPLPNAFSSRALNLKPSP